MKKITIIGGGITGLAAAYIASKNKYKVTVLERAKKFGGLLNTFKIGDTRLEYYYHHFFSHDSELIWLLKELKISNKLKFKKTTMGIFRDKILYDFDTLKDLLFFEKLNLLSKFRFIVSTLLLGKILDWKKYEKISAVKWLQKWAGKEVLENVWLPLLKVKFGDDAKKIPLSWLIGRVSQRLNSRKYGSETLGYIDGSTQVLLDEIVKKLKKKGVKLEKNSNIKSIITKKNVLIELKYNNKIIKGGKFLFTTPSDSTLQMIKNLNKNLSFKLRKIEYLGAICLVLILKKKITNYYWLNIADEKLSFGGIIEQTNFIRPSFYNNNHIVYLSKYFNLRNNLAKKNKKEIFNVMIKDLKKVVPTFSEANLKKYFLFRTYHAAVLNDLNFSKKIINCNTAIKNLYIANMMHIYPDERSINNSIRVAANACQDMDINSKFVPTSISLAGKIGFHQ